MRRFDHGTLRSAGFVALLVVVFLTVNTAVAAAADGSDTSGAGGLLAPLNVTSSEGAPLDGYELGADGGSVVNVAGQTKSLLLGGLFTVARLLVGLACWVIEFAFRFPLITALLRPAQKAADAYNTHVVGVLGLKGLLLGWGFIFGLILFMRGKIGEGIGEIVLTLLIAAFAASIFIRPDYLLAQDGPLDQTHQASLEVAQITTNSYFGKSPRSGTGDPCDLVVGPARGACDDSGAQAKQVTRPIQDALTNALIVKPYMLLEYGRVLDPKSADDKAAYKAHLKWVKGDYEPSKDEDPCQLISGPAQDYCRQDLENNSGLARFAGPDEDKFDQFIKDLGKAGDTGKAAADYAKSPSWDRVGAVLLLLIAVAAIAAMVVSIALVLLGTQGADAGAAAVGGIAWVWGMLPGPSRMAVWRWFGIYIVSVMVMFVAAMAIPMFGIAVDSMLTSSGPDLMVERLLLLDALAIASLAFHRRLIAATSQFGQRLALRMRYAKVGGTHLPGDTSELGAALAMNGPGGGGSPRLLAGPSAAHAALGARHRILGNLATLSDGTGMPFDPGRMLGEAMAEGRRGLAPAALGLAGARLGLRGAHAALIGPKPPEEDESVKLLRVIAKGTTGTGTGPGGADDHGTPMTVNTTTGEILHDPETDRPLLGSRIHQRASRFRGYRIASRAYRIGYGATLGLPRSLKTGRGKATEFTQDARTQLKVAANRVRQDAGEWAPVGRAAVAGARATGAFTRDAAVGAAIFTSTPTVGTSGPRGAGGGATAASRPEDPAADARRRVFDALMRAQRSTWTNPPPWGGDGE